MTRTLIKIRDHAKNEQSFSVDSGVDLTAANFDTEKAKSDALVSAISGVTLGVVADQQLIAERSTDSAAATSVSATIYTDWIIEYTDSITGTGLYRTRIGTPDITNADLTLPFSNDADLSNAAWVTFKDAFEGYVNTPQGNAASITAIYLAD